jgi:hypothetical protein
VYVSNRPNKQSLALERKKIRPTRALCRSRNRRAPENSPRDNTSSIPVYTVIVNTLAIGASMQEYSNAVVNTTYQFLLKTHGLQAHSTDMRRCDTHIPPGVS